MFGRRKANGLSPLMLIKIVIVAALICITMSTLRQKRWNYLFVWLLVLNVWRNPVTAQGLLKWRLGIQNILTSYLTYADHKLAYDSWPELSQQLDIWVYLHLTVQCTQSLLLCGDTDLTLIATSTKQLTVRMEKAEIGIIRRWFVSAKCCLNSDMLWPLGALRACWFFDVPHTFCLPWWVGKTKPEQAQRSGATTLRCCCCSNFRGSF